MSNPYDLNVLNVPCDLFVRMQRELDPVENSIHHMVQFSHSREFAYPTPDVRINKISLTM